MNGNDVYGSQSAWGVFSNVVAVLGSGVYLLVLALFPDGRFVPRWMRWLLPCWALSGMLVLFFPDAFFGWPIYNLVWRVELVLLMIAQVYRSRTASSPLQRQQGKWLLYGGSVVVIIIVGLIVPTLLFPSLGQAGSFYRLAILRYRLYDIDIIIRRTMVYSTLTVLLALIYFGLVFALQSLVHLLTGTVSGQPLVIVASTLAIAGLFQPLRHRIKSMIDRRFYRRKYDAVKTLAAFSTTIRDEVDLNRLSEQLVAVVEETMQPAHVSLWLCAPKRSSEKMTRALPIIDTVGKD